MIQIRPHISDFEQSMTRRVYIESADDVLAYLLCFYPAKAPMARDVKQRHFGRDHRNDWDSWLITLRSSPVLWADAPIPDIEQLDAVECAV
jgi:hypothetical protein